MDDLKKRALALQALVTETTKHLRLGELEQEQEDLKEKSQEKSFWSDNQNAQETMKRLAKLEGRVRPWQKLKKEINDVMELLELDDETIAADSSEQLKSAEAEYAELKDQLKFTGPYDGHDVIVNIFAGAGGTDAQDWAGMLLRMYTRWGEQQKYAVKILEESPGEEAGIKSAALEISGDFAYGKLKGEHGVHRLVRLSPFNADNLRQTSFARVEVLPKIASPDEVELDEKDLKVDVYRSGGHGGQSVNTTDSAVRVTHIPTGITVAIQNERSQLQNKETALTILRSRLAQLQLEQHKDKIGELKGPNEQAAWGNQIRNYVLHPYKQVKDIRTKHESSDPDAVLDGSIDSFIQAYLEHNLNN